MRGLHNCDVKVRWSGEHVPGSPFVVMIFDTEEELNRFLQVNCLLDIFTDLKSEKNVLSKLQKYEILDIDLDIPVTTINPVPFNNRISKQFDIDFFQTVF